MSASSSTKKSVLFICLGNICRSPIAEAVFAKLVNDANVSGNWDIDSAALGGWHVGNSPDKRAQSTVKKHNVPMNHNARQITDDDFNRFDWIFGMDDSNINELNRMKPKGAKAKIELLGDYDPEKVRIIRDPYYDSGAAGFEEVYVQCVRCCTEFLRQNS